MTTSDKISRTMSNIGSSLKGLAKIAIESRQCTVSRSSDASRSLVILGNGPSLATTIAEDSPRLHRDALMAVNFAANTDEFFMLKPEYYIMADPHFFTEGDSNVDRLWQRLKTIDWPMTLYVPVRQKGRQNGPGHNITVEYFNPVGVEGFDRLKYKAYDSGRGMPRPRNVLIAALMVGIKAGYKEIFITGADHSWSRTLSVDDQNRVISVQPHFYKENDKELDRVASVYSGVRLHDIMLSFHIAFKAYHDIAAYARHRGIAIYNATPGSFIDAFERRKL